MAQMEMRRRDIDGDFHTLTPMPCPDCGCTVYHAVEDPELIWEPEKAWDPVCTNRECHCHLAAVIGERRS